MRTVGERARTGLSGFVFKDNEVPSLVHELHESALHPLPELSLGLLLGILVVGSRFVEFILDDGMMVIDVLHCLLCIFVYPSHTPIAEE
jgi:hypothetical protein